LLFDLDGTLVDSSSQISNASNLAREKFNLPKASDEFLFAQIGLPAEALFSDLQISQEFQSQLVVEFREQLYRSISLQNHLYPSVESVLRAFKNAGFFLAIATSKPTYLADSVVRHSPLGNLIDSTLGTGVLPPKPDPSILLKVVEGKSLSKVIMFGDRIEDIQAAKLANFHAIGIAQTVYSKQALLDEGAFLAFDSFVELEFAYKSHGEGLFDVR
jgi:phosphoglycolate phosphatase